MQKHLGSFERHEMALNRRRAAAVTLTVCRDDDRPVIIVTRRSASLRAHSRQWALPGGRRDQGETAVEA
ncbi:NUDIX domain-containing protein, partial [Congregibacter sp.]